MTVSRAQRSLRLQAIPPAAPLLALLTVLLPALVTAARPSAAATAAAAAPAPTHHKVGTSRGEFDLIVYAPRSQPSDPVAGGESRKGEAKPVVLLVSGEGGWKSFDILLSDFLTTDGYWVGGVDAKAYFSDPQDDRGLLAADMRSYATELQRVAGKPIGGPLVLVGYSFGADLAPWLGGAPGWGGRVRGLVMIGPDESGSLEYRITEMLGINYSSHSFSVAEALKSSAGIPTLFLHGEKDGWSKAPKLFAAAGEPKKLITIPRATHHFGGHEEELRAGLRDGLRWILESAAGASPAPRRGR